MASVIFVAEKDRTSFTLTGAEKEFIGEEAHREICSKLSARPPAQELAAEVYGFYGNYLRLIESRRFSSTIYTVRLQHEPLALQSAEIQLRLGTDRAPEALAHELLHLRLFTLGFPLGEIIEIPFPFACYSREYIGLCHWALNLVQHEINYDDFVALGFDRNNFLVRSDEDIGSGQRVKPGGQNGYPCEIDFTLWCFEYLRHFFSARHGGGGDSLRQARQALDLGCRLYPELGEVATEIILWFDIGAYKDPCHYLDQINISFDLMRIPRFTGWAKLELSRPKKPTAVRFVALRNVYD
jgi:hypothetical protein